jgi:exopolysaccharide biosynthesis polyprenyl glycosylphosphotransferase
MRATVANAFILSTCPRPPHGGRTADHHRIATDAFRRGRDIAFSTLLLLAAVPLMALVACLIKLGSTGPVLFRQERVGLRGRCFQVWKFRSMRIDAEASGPVWAGQRDPRVTRVGAFIRTHRIDELPQLVNVLRGEMSLIGPRPERPEFAARLCEAIPGFAARTAVRPGLTGWAQVNAPYCASVEDAREKLEYDLYYIRNRSASLDMEILCRTVMVVLNGTGAR